MDWQEIHEQILRAIESGSVADCHRAKEKIDYIVSAASALRLPLIHKINKAKERG